MHVLHLTQVCHFWCQRSRCPLIPRTEEFALQADGLDKSNHLSILCAYHSHIEFCTGSKLKPEPGPYPRSSDPTRPDPSGTVKFRARTRPEIPPPPPAPQRITKKKEEGCISRLHAKKQINQGSAISQTFTS